MALYLRDAETTACRLASREFDFELEPWLLSGKLRFTEPTEGRIQPASRACPYADLPGVRHPIVVWGDEAWVEGAETPPHFRSK
ncbi:MAG: hypothetical protein H5U40_17535 [Polyangiaceae bacterium]|nr:hypothetical protein [Polyangiaceae bacterium]